MIFQAHPNVWDENKLDEFKKIIHFLKRDSCEFVLPYDYFCNQFVKTPLNLVGEFNKENKTVILKWIDNNKIVVDYNIQRSEDSIMWKSIGIMSSQENKKKSIEDTLIYVDTTHLTKTGVIYYKVKLNNNVNNKYTNTIKIKINSHIFTTTFNNKLKIYPNPCKLKTNIEYEVLNNGLVEGAIYNLNGENIMSIFKEIQNPGFIKKEIDISNFMSGLYLFKLLQPKGIIYSNKILIQN
jgi:hypothetical protein